MPAYKDIKKGTWYVKFRYTDWQGNRKETTRRGFATKREAKEFEAEYIRKAQGTADMTLRSLAEIYLEDRKQNIKESSYYVLENVIETYILPPLGSKRLSEMSPNVVREWQNHLVNVGRKDGGRLKPGTLQNINRKLSSLLTFAVKYYGLARNPLTVTGTQGQKERRIDFWDKAEFDTFINAVSHPLYRALFVLLFYSGMRIGEALALEKQDFDGHSITISKTLNRHGNITPPKTESSKRTISLPAIAEKELKDLCGRLPDTQRLFPITAAAAAYQYKQAVNTSGVRYLPIHCLRHAHASLLLSKGIPIPAVSKRLGHGSPQMTMAIYAHATADSDKLITKTLDAL